MYVLGPYRLKNASTRHVDIRCRAEVLFGAGHDGFELVPFGNVRLLEDHILCIFYEPLRLFGEL